MFENDYNNDDYQVDSFDESEKKQHKNILKYISLILAMTIVGGVSGYGGAYLQNKNQKENISTSVATSEYNTTDNIKLTNGSENVSVKNLITETSAGQLTTTDIVKKVSPSVVSVYSEFGSKSNSGSGTGIIMSKDGYIITNAHVVQSEETEVVDNYSPFDFFSYSYGFYPETKTEVVKASKVTVTLSTDENESYDAEIIGLDDKSDLAVLKINANNLIPADFGSSEELLMGDKAIAIGYPLGLGLSTSEGIVSGLNRTIDYESVKGTKVSMTLIQTDAAINPGNSGGPLINAYGQVIGITSSKLVENSVEGMGFAIPISDALPLIEEIIDKGYVSTPQLGIVGSTLSPAVARYYNLPVNEGILVVEIVPGSGAESAGIKEGDIIISADGQKVSSMEELIKIKESKRVGETISVELARSDENQTVNIVLSESSEESK